MTRLTETDVTTLTRDLEAFEARLRRGHRAWACATSPCAPSPTTTGACSCTAPASPPCPCRRARASSPASRACVVAILLHLGCDAWVTTQPDVRGIQAAVAGGRQRPLPRRRSPLHRPQRHQGLLRGRRPGDGRRLRDGARRGRRRALEGRDVLLLGLGPVGRAAARRLVGAGRHGARRRAGRGARRGGARRRPARSSRSTSPTGSRAATSSSTPRRRPASSTPATCARRRSPPCPACRRRSRRRRRRPSARATSTSRSPSASRSWRRARCSDAAARAPAPGVVQSRGAGGRSEGSAWALNPRRRV